MKSYVITTGVVFGLIALVYIWRIIEEGPHLVKEPLFMPTTARTAGLCLWAWRVGRRLQRKDTGK